MVMMVVVAVMMIIKMIITNDNEYEWKGNDSNEDYDDDDNEYGNEDGDNDNDGGDDDNLHNIEHYHITPYLDELRFCWHFGCNLPCPWCTSQRLSAPVAVSKSRAATHLAVRKCNCKAV